METLQLKGNTILSLNPQLIGILIEIMETHRGLCKREIDPLYAEVISQIKAQNALKAEDDRKSIAAAAESIANEVKA